MSSCPNLEDTLLDALEAISEAFVVYDKDGYLVACNRNFRLLYGYSEEEARPGVHFKTLCQLDSERGNSVVDDDPSDKMGDLKKREESNDRKQGVFIGRLQDGRWIQISDRRLSNGGFVSIQSDITDTKQKERQLLEAKQIAELANRAKSDFMANMSHELRTPLNAIIGFSSLLSSEVYGAHSDPRYQDYASDIESAGEHLLTLINEILDLAKIEAGNIRLDESQTSLWHLTQSVKTMVSARSREKNVAMEVAIEPPSLCLYADQIRLKQILMNLTSNAVKFSHPGSVVRIEWRLQDDQVCLTVSDSGVGMEEEFLPHLFEPFHRSMISQTLQSEGTGLGLTLVKKFSDAHDASLHVTSAPDQGTTVSLRFPADRTLLEEPLLTAGATARPE
ncbi:sensor histidine kinase [Sneathiella chinensis]|uniref:histidine kinase n=1 Tax=Sneathiella chinensis TaxID=349750 RepID=A0ABQ5U829_9PROT|nr:PAS domain-containing sensor histidine kinase [Sneathiella chinensis]GLQ07353.1 hypothetical protein GCM10007924_25740 [Sneathiella chinensis]